MKKLIYITLAALIALTSCNKSETLASGEVTVNYTVAVPVTKAALGNGAAINYVWYALYSTDGSLVREFSLQPFTEGKALCPVTMVRDQSYKVVFVAQHYDVHSGDKTPVYAIDAENAVLEMPVSAIANSDNYDLFCFVEEVIDYQGATDAKPLMLARKVAQINYLCTDEDSAAAAALDMTPTASSITLTGVPASYGLISGQVSDNTVTVTYAKAALTTSDLNLLGTAFCLAGDNVATKLELYKGDVLTTTLEVASVPVGLNKRTNIKGAIMTGRLNSQIGIDVDDTDISH